MAVKDEKYFHEKLLALRNALDVLIEELDYQEDGSVPKQNKRRNLTVVRMETHETNYALGTWRKPSALRKTK